MSHVQYVSLKNFRLYILFCLFALSAASCSKNEKVPVVAIGDLSRSNKELFLVDWQVLVPIKVDSKSVSEKSVPIDQDYLRHWGYNEKSITAEEFRKLGTRYSADSLPSSPVNILYKSQHPYVSLTELFKVSDETGYPQFDGAAYYAMCEVKSSLEQDVSVLTDGDDNLKVWVNEQEIY